MRTIHVGFMHPESFWECFVAWATSNNTGTRFCHCELAIGENARSKQHNMSTWSSYWGEGVQKGTTTDLWHRSRKWTWFTITGTQNDSTNMAHFLDNAVSKPYDYLGFLLWMLPNALTPASDSYFCSELCAEALRQSHDLHLDQQNPRKISPNRLYALLQQQLLLVPDAPPNNRT